MPFSDAVAPLSASAPSALACRLAVVEDDPRLLEDLLDYFRWRGAEVEGFPSAEAFWSARASAPWPDLALLDVGLPGESGLALAARLRARSPRTGIVMLTAFGADADRIEGLDQGADAYLVKSASLELIEATCRSVLRRAVQATAVPRAWQLDALKAEVIPPTGGPVALTHMEQLFLALLMAQPGAAVSRRDILARMGKPDEVAQWRNLDGCAARLRRKVERSSGIELPVRSYYGHGYVFGAQALVRGALGDPGTL
jgi:DNA-binding response OmpR family regulator